MNNANPENRLHHIDLLESIGIFFVILYHATTFSFDFVSRPSAIHMLRFYLQGLLSTCVPLFFFANGYLLLNKPFDLKRHARKSLKLAALTFVWGAICVVCMMLIEKEPISAGSVARSVWDWRQGWINHLWFPAALFCIYVFFPLLKTTFDANRRLFVIFTIVSFVFTIGNTALNFSASFVFHLLHTNRFYLGYNFFNLFNPYRGVAGFAIVYFCFGGLACTLRDKIKAIPAGKRNAAAGAALLLSSAALFGVGVFYSFQNGEAWDPVWSGYSTLATFLNVCAIYVLVLSYDRPLKPLRYISENTLGIFFVHMTPILALRPYFVMLPMTRSFTGTVIFSLLILLLSLAVTALLRRIPLLNELVKL